MGRFPSGVLPKLGRHRSGSAVVTLNGHDHYCGRFDVPESRRRYERLIGQWLAGDRQPLQLVPDVATPKSTPTVASCQPLPLTAPPASDLTVVQLLAGWIAFLEASTGRPATDRNSPAARSWHAPQNLIQM